MTASPEPTVRSSRAAAIVAAARDILEGEGVDALTMRRLADSVGIQAPSLYKHFPTKRSVEAALIEMGMLEFGQALYRALESSRGNPIRALLDAYRRAACASPALYRLATAGALPRDELPVGLEDWAGQPFYLATGDPWRAQALFGFAHGMVVLELDERFPPASNLARSWNAGVTVFAGPVRGARARPDRRGAGRSRSKRLRCSPLTGRSS